MEGKFSVSAIMLDHSDNYCYTIQDGNIVRMESCACIRHPATDTWLYLEKCRYL